MDDKQGKGNVLDEGRVEREAKRPFENTTSMANTVAQQVHTTMTAPTIDQQIMLLARLQENLRTFQLHLQTSAAAYEKAVHSLGATMIQDMKDNYAKQELVATQKLVKDLVNHLSAYDLPALQRKIDYLNSMRNI